MPKPTVDRMLAGFKSFKAMYYDQRPERVEDLVNMGQRPEVLLIACSDSRVDPAILTNAEPGEMFVNPNKKRQTITNIQLGKEKKFWH